MSSVERSPRTTHRLGEAERNGLWHCDGPAWKAFYAWGGDDLRWCYCTPGNPSWREANNHHNAEVWAGSITWGESSSELSFLFRELARFGDDGPILFGPNGEPIPVPIATAAASLSEVMGR